MRSIKGLRNRSSAASRGDQQVLAAEGCSYAAAFNLAKNHDKHLLYCNKYYSMLCMTGATPPLTPNRLLAALLYSGIPASIRSDTQYWGGNGRPGRPYGYGPATTNSIWRLCLCVSISVYMTYVLSQENFVRGTKTRFYFMVLRQWQIQVGTKGSTEPTFSKSHLYIATLVVARAQGVATFSAMSGTSLFRSTSDT